MTYERSIMKQGIHPEYNEVVFQDVSTGFSFKSRSTMKAPKDQTIKWEDGNEYPLIKLDISSASHPFYTGKQKVLDTEGRIEKFKKKFGSVYTTKKK
jgi:large subunit ribosomal protein L31